MMISSLLLLAAGLLVIACITWYLGQRATRNRSHQAYLEHTILQLRQTQTFTSIPIDTTSLEVGPSSWSSLISRAGYNPTRRFYAQRLLAAIVLFCFVLFSTHIVIAVLSLLFGVIGFFFYLHLKAERLQQKMAKQLPEFLESMSRLLIIGNSLSSAFQNSLPTMEAPLRLVLERTSALMYSGQNFDTALQSVANQYRSKELHLIAGVVSIAVQFGGRSDLVFQRMARFMRDNEQARQELHALSAEVRLSAWVLAFLPLSMACATLVLNPHLLVSMWQDPTGKLMLLAAVFLQIIGSYWLYKLAKSI